MADATLEEAFLAERPRLFRLAYRMMGTVADAEDVLQDVFVRLRSRHHAERSTNPADHGAKAHGETERTIAAQSEAAPRPVASPSAYLSQAVVRRCLDGWKSARRQREQYVGPWLPEPLAASLVDDPQPRAELAETVSLAFLVVLETLNPVERAVFLLHDVFQYPFDEIAAMVDKTPAACRQLASRARGKIAENRPRFPASPEQHRQLVAQFLAACQSGDLAALQSLLTDDVALVSDGGGQATAARVPLEGLDRVTRFLLGLSGKARRLGLPYSARLRDVNGQPGIWQYFDGRLHSVVSFELEAGRIRRLFFVLNPHKLASLAGTDEPTDARQTKGE